MTDMEFVEMVGAFYRAELARHGNPIRASKAAEAFRSSLIVSLATPSAIKAGYIKADGTPIEWEEKSRG